MSHLAPSDHAGKAQARPAETPPAARGALGRVLRRETRSSRAVAATFAALLVILCAVVALLEFILKGIGQDPWIIDPQAAIQRLARLPEGADLLLLGAVGAVLMMVGLIFFLNAVLPGRRARHILDDRRCAVVVDDEVIASALARRARFAANVMQEQVMVVVSQRSVVVNIRPTSGVPVDEQSVLAAVQDELDRMAPYPRPSVQVNVTRSGVVGA